MDPCSILGDSPNHFLIRIGPIADPIPLEENMIPNATETAAGSDHNRLEKKESMSLYRLLLPYQTLITQELEQWGER